ncbi:hypothetical protein HOA92_00035 [archaeon]|jgi:hypothetical protein|nr:hypothetical protein [archaeon]
MPNWSSNDLYVWGHQVMLDNFKRFINSMKEKTIKSKGELTELSADWFIPRPEFEDNNWFEWNSMNWGTKWDFSDSYREDHADSVFFGFETAWNPPIPVIKKMSEMFKWLNFSIHYFDHCSERKGIVKFSNGILRKEEKSKYYGTRGA